MGSDGMHLTVEEALSIYPLSEARLIAGSKGKQRIVKSINVMDALEILDWIREGEMLLTTAYLIKDNPEKASSLLQMLNRRGSAGLGIKLCRFWNAVPEALIEEAELLGFPLIELPFRFTFFDQMYGLFRAELTSGSGILQTMMAKQRELKRFALQPGRSRSLLDSISGVIGYRMAVIGTRGDVVYNNSEYTVSELLEGWPWQPRNQRCRVGDQAAFRIPFEPEQVSSGYLIYTAIDPLLLPVEEDLFLQGAEMIDVHNHSSVEE
jgi:purine catabolism regulator